MVLGITMLFRESAWKKAFFPTETRFSGSSAFSADEYWNEAVASAEKIVSRKEMSARCIVNVGGTYTLGPVTIGLDIHNLLGTSYHRSGMNTNVIPQQGRWFLATLGVRL